MTVISTIISRHCTAHASDSLVTQEQEDGTCKVLDRETTKIVCVRRWAGILSYWGLAKKAEYGWSTLKWLKAQVSQVDRFATPDEFAQHIGNQLNQELAKISFGKQIEKGIGIHFTAYEWVDGYSIPELFAITNFASTEYRELHLDGVRVTRETYGVAFDTGERGPEFGEPLYRHAVRKFLQSGNILLYNNGDPSMFNSAFSSIGSLFEIARQRHIQAIPTDAKEHRYIVSWPIDLVSKVQRYFV
jgi:hypothetical protein